jgi:putative transposase
MSAYVGGVHTRSVDEILVALGWTGISKSELFRICAHLDAKKTGRRALPCDHAPFLYVITGGRYSTVRVNRQVVS